MKREVSKCRRCSNKLHNNRRNGGGQGAVHNICSNSPCIDKCAWEYDDGEFCEEERGDKKEGGSVFCPKHRRERDRTSLSDYWQKKKNGTFKYKQFQPEELDYLAKLTSDPDNLRVVGTALHVKWNVVVQQFKEKFDGHEKYEERTADQLKVKYWHMQSKKQKK